MSGAGVPRRKILCGRCESHIGDVLGHQDLRLRRRDGWSHFHPEKPLRGEAPVWCNGCKVEGVVNVPLMIEQSFGRRSIRANVRRVYA